jgi:hypothetical protein
MKIRFTTPCQWNTRKIKRISACMLPEGINAISVKVRCIYSIKLDITPVNNLIVLDNVSVVSEMLCYNISYD